MEKSRLWKIVEEKAPRKFKEQASIGKILGTVFWNYQGMIMIEYNSPGRTVIADIFRYTDAFLTGNKEEKWITVGRHSPNA